MSFTPYCARAPWRMSIRNEAPLMTPCAWVVFRAKTSVPPDPSKTSRGSLCANVRRLSLLFSNPAWSGDASIPSTIIKNITALSVSSIPDASEPAPPPPKSSLTSRRHSANLAQSDITYSDRIGENITILASKYATTQNGVIQGLLYVPDLDEDDPCKQEELQYVPSSAVRQANLPPSDYNLIAIAPWFNPDCTRSYLASASTDPIRGFITYRPGNSSEKPPAVEDRIWSLNDHGAWRQSSKFPIYAISGSAGASMVTQLALYSGNVSSVPYGDNITALYSPSPDDYVRIWSEIQIATPNSLPTIWVFILICIGVFLAFVALVSCFMHYAQRRRRISLEQRVMAGEVNLEAMNIKRVRVPVEHVQKFPLFTYNYESKPTSPPLSPTSPRVPDPVRMRDHGDRSQHVTSAQTAFEKDPASPTTKSTMTGLTTNSTSTDYQPRCMICEEDYENRITIIRELPCGHIYHPECIDEFLNENSSLCPQCKASMLPRGYCPSITNEMVRRERAIRRLRGSIVVEDGELEARPPNRRRNNLRAKKLFRPSNNAANAVKEPPPSRQSPSAETRLRMRDLAGAGTDGGQSWDGGPRCRFTPLLCGCPLSDTY